MQHPRSGLHHISYSVSDLDRTISFYVELLGFKLRSRKIYEWSEEYSAAMFSAIPHRAPKNVVVDLAVLEINGFPVEFEQWISPETLPYHGDPSVSGSSHLAIKVPKVEPVVQHLREAQVSLDWPAFTFLEGGQRPWHFCYLWDPDHIMVELVEEVSIESVVTSVGKRLGQTRASHGMSLRELASRTGISASRLSQLERGRSLPSVSHLLLISSALDVLPHYLLGPEDEGLLIVQTRNADKKQAKYKPSPIVVSHPGSSVRVSGSVGWQVLTHIMDASQVLQYTYEVGSSALFEDLRPGENEQIIVLQGRVEVNLGSASQVLEAQQSATYECTFPRSVTNIGSETAMIIRIMPTQ